MRTIVEIVTADGVTGIGETQGDEDTVRDLRRADPRLGRATGLRLCELLGG